MDFKCEISNVMADFEGNLLITLKAPKTAGMVEALQKYTGKSLRAVIKKFAPRRSIDSNNYMWALLAELAAAYKTTKEELYEAMLKRYGVFVYLPAMTDKEIAALEEVFRIVIDRGPATIITMTGRDVEVHQMQCYKGSSCYDREEMTRLLNGIVDECRDEGIDTMTDSEISEMNQRWGLDFEKHSNRRE